VALPALPTANFTVSFGTNVTSRLLSFGFVTPSSTFAANTSEALLLIDEPGSGLTVGPSGPTGTGLGPAGWGPGAPQVLCSVVNSGGTGVNLPASLVGAGPGGCPEYAQQVGGDWVMSSTSSVSGAPVVGANMFSGVVSANQVTFFGVPVMAPASAGVARIFRITNVRINANALGGGSLAGVSQVLASISISGSTSIPVTQPVQIAGFIQSGLTTGVRNVGNVSGQSSAVNFNQCQSQTVSPVAILRYTENFGTAFKTRVGPTATTNGQSPLPGPGINQPAGSGQNIPGAIYNSESGFITTQGGTGVSTIGLADFGTRLKAVFNSVPAGVRIFVSTTNVVNLTGASNTFATPPAGNSTTTFAQLVTSETAAEGSIVPAAGCTNPTQLSGTTICLNNYAELSVVNGSATAVWEIINTNQATPESADFGVWLSYTAAAGTNSPPPGTATVNMSYAPTPPSFTAAAGAAASSTLSIPRFADTSTATSFFTIVQCTTSLLFPFLTNQAGFDTGIAIMNTTTDPFGTKPQAGTCSLNFYGQNAPPVFTTPSIASGNPDPSKYAFQLSSIAPNFEGYMIAICNFQLAHGYAFISDLGARNLAHGYLALVLSPQNVVELDIPEMSDVPASLADRKTSKDASLFMLTHFERFTFWPIAFGFLPFTASPSGCPFGCSLRIFLPGRSVLQNTAMIHHLRSELLTAREHLRLCSRCWVCIWSWGRSGRSAWRPWSRCTWRDLLG
jgi:hypothetical protein